MLLKYELSISNEEIQANFIRLTNQIYKLLPSREEGLDWKRPLELILIELAGLNRLFENKYESLFITLLSKLEGLFTLVEENDFHLFRSTIFKCLNLMGEISKLCKE